MKPNRNFARNTVGGKQIVVIADKLVEEYLSLFDNAMTLIERHNYAHASGPDRPAQGSVSGSKMSFASIIGSGRGTRSPQSSNNDPARSGSVGVEKTPAKEKQEASKPNHTRDFHQDTENDPIADRGFGLSAVPEKSERGVLFAPPARSILHVADLERLVALIRTEKAGAMHAVSVKLNHSVFEGLEFRVSFEKGHGLSAEIVAGSETVRSALLERAHELIRLFAERGIELGSLNVSLGGENRENGRFRDTNKSQVKPQNPPTDALGASKNISFESSTSYLS
ncbi:MAG: hypothetical protein OEM82_13935 [Acidobacteriota bacterium]|nr:hypothetical protein [Acidobacteriota bacterium]MDH3530083.1 hypothetical protein [Acidobacteriota bacterium]